VLHEKNFKWHVWTIFDPIFPHHPRDGVWELYKEIVKRRVFERKPWNVRRSNKPHACLPVTSYNYLIFHTSSLSGKA